MFLKKHRFNMVFSYSFRKHLPCEGHLVNLRLWGWGGDSGQELGAFEGCADNIYDIGIDITEVQTWGRRLEEEELWYKICM